MTSSGRRLRRIFRSLDASEAGRTKRRKEQGGTAAVIRRLRTHSAMIPIGHRAKDCPRRHGANSNGSQNDRVQGGGSLLKRSSHCASGEGPGPKGQLAPAPDWRLTNVRQLALYVC
ncbi:terminal uridylyltransferase 7-like, partial [Ixodes scapularis]